MNNLTAKILNKITHRLLGLQTYTQRVDLSFLLVLALPWLLLLVNRSWILGAPETMIDAMVYHGTFLNFEQYVHVYSGTYYITRLPWILPGYICYKLFPPLVANYVLHLVFYYIALLSFYFTLKLTVGRRAALIASIMIALFPSFLAALGWDYIDGAVIAYFLLTMLLLTLAAKSSHWQSWLSLFLAGTSLAALVFTNTYLLIAVPVVALYYIFVNHNNSKNSLVMSAVFAALGFIALTAVLGAINKAYGGSFLFFWPSFRYAWYMFSNPNPWKAPDYAWLKNAFWLAFPILIFLSSIAFLLYSRFSRSARSIPLLSQPASIFSLCYLLLFLLMLIDHLKGDPVLQFYYYADYLLPPLFLAAGSQIARPLAKFRKWQFFWLAVGLLAFLLLLAYLPFNEYLKTHVGAFFKVGFIALGITLAGIIVWWLLRRNGSRAWSTTLFCFFIGLAYLALVFTHAGMSYGDYESLRDRFLAIEKSVEVYRPYNTAGTLRFWYPKDEPQSGIYCLVASTDFWGYRLVNENFPNLKVPNPTAEVKVQEYVPIPAGINIVILSSQPDAFAKAEAAFSEVGQRIEFLGEEEVVEGSVQFTMTFIEVKDDK